MNENLNRNFQDWAKGQFATSATFSSQRSRPQHSSHNMFASSPTETEADLCGQLIRIADLYGQVITYINSGGKALLQRPPWDSESSFGRLDMQLELWANALTPFNKYTDANAQAHVVIGSAAIYGFMHVLYYSTFLSIICVLLQVECLSVDMKVSAAVLYLHRDFIPFLPTSWNPAQPSMDEGKGPPPFVATLNTMVPYQSWFLGSRDRALAAASAIAEITLRLPLTPNPFCGFAVLSSATMHAMAYWFPEKYGLHDTSQMQARLLHSARFLKCVPYCSVDQGNVIKALENAEMTSLWKNFSNQAAFWPISSTWAHNLAKLYEMNGVLKSNSTTNPNTAQFDIQDTSVRQGVVNLLPPVGKSSQNSSANQIPSTSGASSSPMTSSSSDILIPCSIAPQARDRRGSDLINLLSENLIISKTEAPPTSPFTAQTTLLPLFPDPTAVQAPIDDYLHSLALPSSVDWSSFSTYDSYWFNANNNNNSEVDAFLNSPVDMSFPMS